MKGHVHQALMAQYAEDAKTTDKPWQLWEILNAISNEWAPMAAGEFFYDGSTYRRKPKMKLIHGVEVPDISISSPRGFHPLYYVPNPLSDELYSEMLYSGDDPDVRLLCIDFVYPRTEEGKQAAILHAKAMIGIKP